MEILNKIQKEVLGLFAKASDSDHFYLTGGTALSFFYLKHRKSNDLDFFTATEKLILPFSYTLEETLKNRKITVNRQRGMHSFVELLIEDNNEKTVLHLAYDSPYRIGELKTFPEFPNLKVDNLIDICANKLLALFGRAALRDFIDIYFLIKKEELDPQELVKNAKVKDPGFDLYWLGVALERINTYKGDALDMLLLLEPVNFNELSDFFNVWRRKIAEELTK